MKSSGYDNNKLQTTYETTFGGTPDNDKKHEKIEGNLANKQKNHTFWRFMFLCLFWGRCSMFTNLSTMTIKDILNFWPEDSNGQFGPYTATENWGIRNSRKEGASKREITNIYIWACLKSIVDSWALYMRWESKDPRKEPSAKKLKIKCLISCPL